MTTIPNGAPAWVRSNDHTSYGGALDKANHQNEPIVNPRTDVGAEHLQRIAEDLAVVARMADFAVLDFTMASGSSSPTVHGARLMTGIYSGAGYTGTSPPTGFPTVRGISDGIADIEFAASYSDDYSVAGVFEPVFADAAMAGSTYAADCFPAAWPQTATSVRVKVQTSTGTGVPSRRVVVRVS